MHLLAIQSMCIWCGAYKQFSSYLHVRMCVVVVLEREFLKWK